ncbi:DUF2849 domain-containing protein [Kordiimonas marina]|uniref:DUF2849 domain-containing protein n=1 Tax=Kordiimonas marina TaxID=2872312 RepID=UPI001FF42CC0|nr:DUF2849 domain-containing protein [Kordiimonas marina]MCJ9428488.1 DUF2849 domain-containing protein [Kordiimonas marina]
MAKKISGPQMVIANRLDDGRVVFLTSSGDWSARAADAAVADDDVSVDALRSVASASEAANRVLSVEVIEADVHNGVPHPAHMKFAMQAKGPSVRADLGYQVSPDWER